MHVYTHTERHVHKDCAYVTYRMPKHPTLITPKTIACVMIGIPTFYVHQDPVKKYSTSSVDYVTRTLLSSSLSANAKIQACAKLCVEEAKCLSFSYKSYCYLYV